MKALLATCAVAAVAATTGLAQPSKGFQAELLNDFEETSHHLVQLADAIPEGKYGWRPREGVRSVSEVFVHIAAANYLLLSFTGVKPPAEYFPAAAGNSGDRALLARMHELETAIAQKDRVERMLKDSLEQFRGQFSKLTAADLDKPVEWFGHSTTVRGICLRIFAHNNEHYGQLVAYARVIGVTPPWSQ
jgi:uncharacterized damage-inducible protein DinB